MSKTRWILVLAAVAFLMAVGPLTTTSVSVNALHLVAERQEREIDWCCLAGLSCCIIPPTQ
ncbi:MAG TPA: hypothetical protein VE977_12880 [Pyrinomonadaceae bacterium]|nr:hypothetical protein [Pyrinomonadaceae bacterium]